MVVTLIELNGVLGCDKWREFGTVPNYRHRRAAASPVCLSRRLIELVEIRSGAGTSNQHDDWCSMGFRPAEMRTLHPFGKLLSARPLGRLVQPRNLWVLRPSRFREPLMMNFSDLSGEPNLAGA